MNEALETCAGVIREAACPIGDDADYESLLEMAGEAQCVLIGEASHGTQEFYETRAKLTRRLIQEKAFGLSLWRRIGRTPSASIGS